jgi:dephospho-CoA kinase
MRQNNRPVIIGITGNIGSGKSTFSDFISKRYKVISADYLAHKALTSVEVVKKLVQRWGEKIMNGDSPDRKKIAEIVYEDRAELQFLNKTIHPVVLRDMQNAVDHNKNKYLFFEVPLLFEAKLEKCFDHIVLVTAEKDLRIKRICNRDNKTASEILPIMLIQMHEEYKIKHSDTVIENNGSLEDLKHQAQIFLKELPRIPFQEISSFSALAD